MAQAGSNGSAVEDTRWERMQRREAGRGSVGDGRAWGAMDRQVSRRLYRKEDLDFFLHLPLSCSPTLPIRNFSPGQKGCVPAV